MSKLIILTIGVLAICGCAKQEKTRSVDMKGSYVPDSGKAAFGSVKIQSAKGRCGCGKIVRDICSALRRMPALPMA